jgi:hypothetical protein
MYLQRVVSDQHVSVSLACLSRVVLDAMQCLLDIIPAAAAAAAATAAEKVRPQLLELEEAFMAANPGLKVQRVPAQKPAAKGFGGSRR